VTINEKFGVDVFCTSFIVRFQGIQTFYQLRPHTDIVKWLHGIERLWLRCVYMYNLLGGSCIIICIMLRQVIPPIKLNLLHTALVTGLATR